MKMIAGSILAGFGLLAVALGGMRVRELLPPGDIYTTKYYLNLDSPVSAIAIVFIILGILLVGWGIWEDRNKKV
jgi:hypothetical protein